MSISKNHGEFNFFLERKKNDKNKLIKYNSNSFTKNISILKLFKNKIITIISLCIFYFSIYSQNISEPIYSEIEKYIRLNLAGELLNSKSPFFKRENPKISIIISTFNGEIYLKPAVRSIQNQNFLNIEIIIVDDGSMDNTVKAVNILMEEDKRIKLISNVINRGTLYTKTKGVLNAKGKYILTLDHDNLYSTNYVFSNLYHESEKYNLDLLGFSTIGTSINVINYEKNNFINYFETPIIRKPNIKRRFLGFVKGEESGTFLCLYLIKKQLFLEAIMQLGDKFIKRNIDEHDDSILMFLLSRKASSLKHLKKIFYIYLEWPNEYKKALKFQRNMKYRERKKKKCY